MSEVIYLPHPVSAEEKAKHKADGKKIMDIVYAPAEYLEMKKEQVKAPAKRAKQAKDEE